MNNLDRLDIKTASLPSKMIRHLLHSRPQCKIVSNAGVFIVFPCRNYRSEYIAETSRNIHACLKEHKKDIRVVNLSNALLQYISQSNHNFNFSSAKMLIYIHFKRLR